VDAPYRTDLPASQETRRLGCPGLFRGGLTGANVRSIGGRRFVLAGRWLARWHFLAAARPVLWPLGAVPRPAPRLAPIVHSGDEHLRQGGGGGRRKEFCAATAAAGRFADPLYGGCCSTAGPDDCWWLMCGGRSLIQERLLRRSLIGTVLGGLGHRRHHGRHSGVGGVAVCAPWHLTARCGCCSIAGRDWQLRLLGAGPFGGGVPGLLLAGAWRKPGGRNGGTVLFSWPCWMSRASGVFSATQFTPCSPGSMPSRQSWPPRQGVVAEQVGWPRLFLFTALAPARLFPADAATHPLEGNGVSRRV